LAVTERGLAHVTRAGDRSWEVSLLAGNVSSLALLGRWDEALEIANELGESMESYLVANMLEHAAEIDCWRGETARARARLEAGSRMGIFDDPQSVAGHALHEAIVLRAEGNPSAALEKLRLTLEVDHGFSIGFIVMKLAVIEELECACALGDTPRLERVLDSIDELRPGERPPMLAAHAARFRARITTDGAEGEFRRAAEIFREHELVFWLAVTQLEHGEWLNGQDRGEEAEPLLAEAHETFERLQATPWIHRAAEARLRDEPAEALV